MGRYFLFTLFCFTALAQGTSYDLADLRALAQEGSYQEFLAHAMDVRPSERGEEWRGMVSRMALKFAKNTLDQRPIQSSDFKKTEEIYRWPALRGDDVFKARRMEIGLSYLKNCINQETPCWEELRVFWKEDMTDPDISIGLAEMIKDKKDAPIDLWALIESPLKTPLSEYYCKRPFIMEALWNKLSMDYLEQDKEITFLSKIENTIHADCLPELVKEAKEKLIKPNLDGDRELGFQILAATKNAGQGLKDFFYTLYLLEHPAQGELMNLAWNNLSELGRAPGRRERIIIEMKKLDPLPDSIMGSLDLSKRRAVLRHIKSNFPEYFDYYSHQCVSYYSGSKKFSQGNPTMKCQELMNSDLATELLPESKIRQFKDVTKI